MRIQKKSSRALKRAMATVLSFALAMSAVAVAPTADAASKKKPKLSAKKKTLYYNGKKTFTLKVKKGKKVKKIKKTTWKTSNKKVVKISKKKKTSVKLTAKKKGSAKITAVVKYTVKGSKKVKKVKLTCKVTSKKKTKSTSTSTNAPASQAPATTAPAGGGQSGTQSKAPAASQPAASAAPSTKPEESVAPSTNPEESVAPSTNPEESVAPSTEPEESAAPSTNPEESVAPSTNPEESVAPSTNPEESVAPSTEPEESAAPSTKPEESIAPSTKPEESAAPSTKPEESANPASGSAAVVITGSAVSGSSVKMEAGDTAKVSADVTVSGCAVSGSYVWASSDTKVATVSGSGADAVITAVAKGTAKVTVTIATTTGLKATGSVTVLVGDVQDPDVPDVPVEEKDKSITLSFAGNNTAKVGKTQYQSAGVIDITDMLPEGFDLTKYDKITIKGSVVSGSAVYGYGNAQVWLGSNPDDWGNSSAEVSAKDGNFNKSEAAAEMGSTLDITAQTNPEKLAVICQNQSNSFDNGFTFTLTSITFRVADVTVDIPENTSAQVGKTQYQSAGVIDVTKMLPEGFDLTEYESATVKGSVVAGDEEKVGWGNAQVWLGSNPDDWGDESAQMSAQVNNFNSTDEAAKAGIITNITAKTNPEKLAVICQNMSSSFTDGFTFTLTGLSFSIKPEVIEVGR